MTYLCYLFAAREFEFDFEKVLLFFCCCSACLFLFSFSPSFFLGGATAAALKSKAAVDGKRKEVADRVASLQACLLIGNRELESYAARASPLSFE